MNEKIPEEKSTAELIKDVSDSLSKYLRGSTMGEPLIRVLMSLDARLRDLEIQLEE